MEKPTSKASVRDLKKYAKHIGIKKYSAWNKQKLCEELDIPIKAKKDPNMPKRGRSSYIFYCQDNRDKVKKSLGTDATFGNVNRGLSQGWKNVTEKQKAKYVAMAEADKKRYENDLALYNEKKGVKAVEKAEGKVEPKSKGKGKGKGKSKDTESEYETSEVEPTPKKEAVKKEAVEPKGKKGKGSVKDEGKPKDFATFAKQRKEAEKAGVKAGVKAVEPKTEKTEKVSEKKKAEEEIKKQKEQKEKDAQLKKEKEAENKAKKLKEAEKKKQKEEEEEAKRLAEEEADDAEESSEAEMSGTLETGYDDDEYSE